jgi:hypothetical protein
MIVPADLRSARANAAVPTITLPRVLALAGLPSIGQPSRPSPIDPFLPFIRQTPAKFPKLTAASRLFV